MNWTQEDGYRYDKKGNLLRSNQDEAPKLAIGDRFFDVANGRWALLLEILPKDKAMGAPFRSLYEGCERFQPFVATAMHADIGEIEKLSAEIEQPA